MLRSLAVLLICLLWHSVLHAEQETRPNVLFIAVDDLNDWVGCLGGHPQAHTPNIDRLAKRGMLFTNAHCPAPLCNPSRTAVMTGLLPSTSGVHGNEQDWHQSPYLKGHSTLPRWFQEHGYFTAGCGKLFHANHGGESAALNGGHGGLQGFDDFPAWEARFPVKDRQLVADAVRPGQNFNGLNIWHWDWGPIEATEEEMADGKAVAWAAEQLSQPQEKPLFLAVGIYKPHSPWYVPKQYYDERPGLDEIVLPEVREDDLEDVPEIAKGYAKGANNLHAVLKREELWHDAVRAYLATVTFTDAMVGRLLDALDASPNGKKTIIVLWSDHGWHLGEKQRWHKSTLWEEATRVPLIVVAPGMTDEGGRCARAVSLIDLYPTLCELCELPLPERNDGKSLVPLLKNPEAEGHPPAVTVLGGRHVAVRSDRWRFNRYADGSEELYDHEADPNEWTNLAKEEQYTAVKADLAKHLPETIATYEEDRSSPNEPGFRPMFNGYDLTSWKGDERVWKVEEGKIVGEVPEGIDPDTVPLVWEGGELKDFELRLRFELKAEDVNANPAVAYHSNEKGEWLGVSLSKYSAGQFRHPGGGGSGGISGAYVSPYRDGLNELTLIVDGTKTVHGINGTKRIHEELADGFEAGPIMLVAPQSGRIKFDQIRLREIGGK